MNRIAPGLVRTPMSVRAQADARLLEYKVRKQLLTRGLMEPDGTRRHRQGCVLPSEKGLEPNHGLVLTVDAGWAVSA